MSEQSDVIISDGFQSDQRARVAFLFWQAFKNKLSTLMKPEEKALQFFEKVIDQNFAISATKQDGTFLGIAGFKIKTGSFAGGDLQELRQVYGLFSGIWRGLALSLLERPLKENILLMDGIFVEADARGQGIGTKLLRAIKQKAKELECHTVRLDVIDTNPRAKNLYEREGFVASKTEDIGMLRHIFGFQKSTVMLFRLD